MCSRLFNFGSHCTLTWRGQQDNLPSTVIHSITAVPDWAPHLFSLMSIVPSPSLIIRGTNSSVMFIVPSPANKCNYRALLIIAQTRMRLVGLLNYFEFTVYKWAVTLPSSATLNTKEDVAAIAPTYWPWSYSEMIIKKSAGLRAMHTEK